MCFKPNVKLTYLYFIVVDFPPRDFDPESAAQDVSGSGDSSDVLEHQEHLSVPQRHSAAQAAAAHERVVSQTGSVTDSLIILYFTCRSLEQFKK